MGGKEGKAIRRDFVDKGLAEGQQQKTPPEVAGVMRSYMKGKRKRIWGGERRRAVGRKASRARGPKKGV